MTLLFNPAGNDSDRKMIDGNTTNLINLNDSKYLWGNQIYQTMRDQMWIPQKFDVTGDVNQYRNLTEHERKAFDGTLSYLTFLDSLQTNMIPHIMGTITAPEVRLCLAEQISQEALHNASYQYIIESLIDKERRADIYENWRVIPELANRIQTITRHYQNFIDHPNRNSFLTALFADYLLEGIYFMNGFVFFYNLGRRGLMPGCVDIFKLINRDENNHVRLYQKIIETLFNEEHYEKDKWISTFREMTKEAVKSEVEWSNHILGNQILGINAKSTEEYTMYLADLRLKDIGLEPIYGQKINPYAHLDSKKSSKQNFFEAGVTEYKTSNSIGDWGF